MGLYTLLVRCYALIIRIASLRSNKARQWVAGRKHWRKHLKQQVTQLGQGSRIWVHCASYGEFEQGRPLMEAIKKQRPDQKIILTFFSPSGFEAFKNWSGADVICYLPIDTKRNAADFIEIVKPTSIVFVKYEFWVNFLFRIKNLNIPAFLVSAVFKPHHPFFKWYGGFFRKSLRAFKVLFIQDDASGNLLKSIGVNNYEVSGDTRFDRVVEIKENFKPLALFDQFCEGHRVVVAGSSWPGDEELLISALKSVKADDLKWIIAPHNVDGKHIAQLKNLLQKNDVSFTSYTDTEHDLTSDVLIIDTIGLLSKIYHYADVTYIGGGFNSGIHNCLEPAVFLKPVLFYGEGYEKYNEAVDLINMGAARNVMSLEDLSRGISHFLEREENLRSVKTSLKNYFDKNSGVTQKILKTLFN